MSVFYIVDEKMNYIREDKEGKYISTKNKETAHVFDKKWKAEKVLKNNISPRQRKRYHIVEGVEKKEILKNKEHTSEIDSLRIKIENIKKFMNGLEARKKELAELLSNTDKEIIDIEHYIELYDVNNDNVISTYDMFKKCLIKRRQIKNELSVLRQLEGCKMDASMFGELLTYISELNNKTYVPRVLTNLFIDNK